MRLLGQLNLRLALNYMIDRVRQREKEEGGKAGRWMEQGERGTKGDKGREIERESV